MYVEQITTVTETAAEVFAVAVAQIVAKGFTVDYERSYQMPMIVGVYSVEVTAEDENVMAAYACFRFEEHENRWILGGTRGLI